jgi:transcriptional regulator with XRE-family HTH domain
MKEETQFSNTVHYGRNIKRLREMLGIKQEAIAFELNVTQQAISDLEKKAMISDDVLEKISKIFNIPVDTIKSFNDETAISIIANTFNDVFHENSSFLSYQPVFNPIDKIIELYERMLRIEQEKIVLLEKIVTLNTSKI